MAESMRERLERLRNKGPVRPPLSREDLDSEPTKKLLSPESLYMKKVDKLVTNMINLKKKMSGDSGSYLSLYYDLKKAEKQFLDALEDPEVQFLDMPEFWTQKIEDIKKQVLSKNK
jgi:hypothetical protein